jgi:hypothetical protein
MNVRRVEAMQLGRAYFAETCHTPDQVTTTPHTCWSMGGIAALIFLYRCTS